MILVLPANPDMLMYLRHPNKGVRRFVNMTTPVEWPLDQFTIRRLRDGDITKVGDAPRPPLLRRDAPRFLPATKKKRS